MGQREWEIKFVSSWHGSFQVKARIQWQSFIKNESNGISTVKLYWFYTHTQRKHRNTAQNSNRGTKTVPTPTDTVVTILDSPVERRISTTPTNKLQTPRWHGVLHMKHTIVGLWVDTITFKSRRGLFAASTSHLSPEITRKLVRLWVSRTGQVAKADAKIAKPHIQAPKTHF